MWVSSNKLPQCLWIHVVVPGPSITPNPHQLTPMNVTISHLWCPWALVLVKTASVLTSGWRFGLRKIFVGLTWQAFIAVDGCGFWNPFFLGSVRWLFAWCFEIIHYHLPLKCFLCKQQCVAESFWQQCHCRLPPPPVLTVSWQGCQSVRLWYRQRKENLKGVVVVWCLGGCFKEPYDI